MGSKRFWTTAAAVGLCLALVAVTLATMPGSDGVITACYNKSGSALRVIDSSVTQCGSNEIVLTWNQVGQQGPSARQQIRPLTVVTRLPVLIVTSAHKPPGVL